ncbi:hypothetical protein [Chitiniphilus shinanonensis]|uniref:hypothetical protein n=1 Tax=Chitiniphilus shinanonensis TaxID=553088 RepID=UPI003041E79C
MSKKMKDKNKVILYAKLIWLAMVLFILIGCLSLYDEKIQNDIDILLAYLLLLISFPTGPVVLVLIGFAGKIANSEYGVVFEVNYVSMLFEWAFFSLIIYFQWFIFFPWMWKKFKNEI